MQLLIVFSRAHLASMNPNRLSLTWHNILASTMKAFRFLFGKYMIAYEVFIMARKIIKWHQKYQAKAGRQADNSSSS